MGHRIFPFGDEADYEPPASESLVAVAENTGVTPAELLYEWQLRDGGRQMFNVPILNYAAGSFEPLREMLEHPNAVLGLGDGGAHVAIICDASISTTMLTHWTRDRTRGPRLPLELVVRRQTSDTARLYGLLDRGRIAPGYRADLNLIDYDRLRVHVPTVAYDLPGGARRIVQKADGYAATIVAGQVVAREGEPTGALPGRLVRGAQPAPA
jgi:N-acyl-D-aspartate/D-glutamate deacylase